jgi:hypothetical protein
MMRRLISMSPTLRYYVEGFPGAFKECSDWAAQVLLPWRWVVTFYEAVQELRQHPPVEGAE